MRFADAADVGLDAPAPFVPESFFCLLAGLESFFCVLEGLERASSTGCSSSAWGLAASFATCSTCFPLKLTVLRVERALHRVLFGAPKLSPSGGLWLPGARADVLLTFLRLGCGCLLLGPFLSACSAVSVAASESELCRERFVEFILRLQLVVLADRQHLGQMRAIHIRIPQSRAFTESLALRRH